MDEHASRSHTKWECKDHVVFMPKCRRTTLYTQLRKPLGEVVRQLAAQKASRIEAGHRMPDHVHMMMAIPPQHAVSQVLGSIKGKSARHLARGVRGAQAQLRGAALVGPRVCCFDGWAR